MENLSSIFRILVLTAGALWLTRIQTIHAQGIGPCYGSTCIKQFDTEFGSACYDCCSSQPLANDIIDGVIDASQGLYSPQNNTMDCGNTNACVGVSCGTQTYCTAVLDATCCLPAGTPCNQGTCCSGLICLSNNTCGACIGGGGACGANSDCCSSVCCNGTCTNNTCSCPDTALCDDYTLSQLTTACTRKADVPPAITGSELLIPGFLIESPRFSWNWPSFSLKESYVTLSYPTAYPVATRVRNLCGYPEIGARFAERCARWPGNNSLTGDNPCGKNNPYHPGVVHGTTSFPQNDRQDRTPFAPLSWPDFQKAHRAAIPPIFTGRPDRESRAPIA